MKGSAQPHLEQFFQQKLHTPAAPAGKERDEGDSLPTEDSDYKPYAMRSIAPEYSLICIKADGTPRGFQYIHLDSDSGLANQANGQCITLRFMCPSACEVKIHGRNLRQLFDFIHQHRTAWVREAARPYADDDESIVTNITITPLKDVENANGN